MAKNAVRKAKWNKTHTCKWCQKPFRASRADAEFDTDKCRSLYNYQLKKIDNSRKGITDGFDLLLDMTGDPLFRSAAIASMLDIQKHVTDKLRRVLMDDLAKADE